jgi:DNA-binding CsgD family transcriptional regulator/PAS domain-containing protein
MADPTRDAVTALIGQIYEAAYDHERWRDAVVTLSDTFSGSRACIMRVKQSQYLAIASVDDPELTTPKAAAALLGDPWAQLALGAPVGDVVHRVEVLDEPAFRRRDLWNDWLKSRDMHDGITCKLASKPDEIWMIDVHRGGGQDTFSRSDMDLFRSIASHTQRAGQIGEMLEKTKGLASAFSRLPFGVVVVDRHMRITHINEAVETLAARPDSPLRISRGEICTRTPRDDRALQQLVFASCSPIDLAKPGSGAMFLPSISPGAGETRLTLSVAPFASAPMFGLATEQSAVILIREVTRSTPDVLEDLRGMFDLTPAEARIAAALAAGRSLQQAAEANGIQISTARSYLEATFRKTGTHRQGELIALLTGTRQL